MLLISEKGGVMVERKEKERIIRELKALSEAKSARVEELFASHREGKISLKDLNQEIDRLWKHGLDILKIVIYLLSEE